jgi:hypothetical protein
MLKSGVGVSFMAKSSQRGASRTLTEVIKGLSDPLEACGGAEELQSVLETIRECRDATMQVKDGRNTYRDEPDFSTRLAACRLWVSIAVPESTQTSSKTEVESESEPSKQQKVALPQIDPALERRILEDRLASLPQMPE